MEATEFQIGQRWVSHNDTALGLGIVTDISGRRVTLGFPAADEERTYAMDNAPLSRIVFQMGEDIETFDGERLTVRAVEEIAGLMMYHADDGGEELRKVSEVRLSSRVNFSAPHQRLFAGQFDRNGAFRLRVATREHQSRLRSSPVQGLIGARTRHLPHQVYIAHEVARRHAPRVLLADEVGLGKTIEAGLILHYQLHTGHAGRVLVIVPDSLVHQWLVEMLRRFNLRFSIIDDGRYEAQLDEETDTPANPFEEAQLVICSQDFLARDEQAREDAIAASWDLLVVDEAHHLTWSPDQASEEYRLVETLAGQTPGVLLLTATPEQVGVASHFARLRLLDPARFHDLDAFLAEEADYTEVNRVVRELQAANSLPQGVDLEVLRQWLGSHLDTLVNRDNPVDAVVSALLDRHGTGRVLFRNTRDTIRGFPERRVRPVPMELPDCYRSDSVQWGEPGLTPEQSVDEEQWLAEDPRVAWLEQTLKTLRPAKVVVICARADTAIALEHYLQLRAGIRSAAFHEHLSLLERDRAAAWFADEEQGAQALICSEIGSEGRNFQFAHHLVLFDLPAHPDLLEQRIGRLDRIGQADAIDIHVPWLRETRQEIQYRWFDEGLNAFAKSCAIGTAVLEKVRGLWQSAMAGDAEALASLLEQTCAEAAALREKLHEGRDALIELNSCRTDQAKELIGRIEEEENSEALWPYMEQACDILGVEAEEHSACAHILRPGENYRAGYLPGLPDDGVTATWDRERALEREDMVFMSWEHPMVSGMMDAVTDSGLGKAALASLSVKGLPAGTLMLEALFAVHCPAPAGLQLSRYLPMLPLRFLVDVNGRDLSEVLPHDRLNGLCSNIRRRTAQEVVPRIRAEVETLVDHASRMAAPHLEPLRARALESVRGALEPEIERLEALREVNPAVREEEIGFYRNQLAAAEAAIENASLDMDGIRVIVTA